MSLRPVKKLSRSKPTLEGAGVHLRRAFGFGTTQDFDPFLLLDDFRNDVPADYLAGFPWHPHRGIETITYVLSGTVEHGDSMGNQGAIGAGDVQWMTAGSGIIHQEMPKGDAAGRMHGFQLWANLPAALKMTPPRYQEVKAAEIPEVTDDDGAHGPRGVRPFLGNARAGGRHRGRSDLSGCYRAAGAEEDAAGGNHAACLRIRFWRRREILQRVRPAGGSDRKRGMGGHHAAHGGGQPVAGALRQRRRARRCRPATRASRFLLCSGQPLQEPVAWYGPIVMNTQEQLRQAFTELEEGTFLKRGKGAA